MSNSPSWSIEVAPIGHWHVLVPKKLVFTVREQPSGRGVEGLNLNLQIARAGSSTVLQVGATNGEIKEEKAGLYSFEYTPVSLGSYALLAHFVYQGREVTSAPVAFEVVRDGDEGVRLDRGGNTFVYQVRYNWEPGDVVADEKRPVRLVFELMRGLQEGSAIQWAQPWRNAFDHVQNAQHPQAVITSPGSPLHEKVAAAYRGMGVYEAQRMFAPSEVGPGRVYHVRFEFTDPYHGSFVTHAEPYVLRADLTSSPLRRRRWEARARGGANGAVSCHSLRGAALPEQDLGQTEHPLYGFGKGEARGHAEEEAPEKAGDGGGRVVNCQ